MTDNAAVFVAHDAAQREHLLKAIGWALDRPDDAGVVSRRAFEGDDTSVYLFSFYDVGVSTGYQLGRERGMDLAIDHYRGDKPSVDTVARAARHQAKQARKRNRRAKR